MARRLIGTGTTNSQGVATITYTGVGKGKMQLVAESGDLSSAVYTLYDCTSYDSGVDSEFDQYWSSTGMSRTVESTGTTFSNDSSSNTIYAFLLPPDTTATSIQTSCVYPVENYCVEVEVVSYTGIGALELRGDNGNLVSRRFDLLTSDTSFTLRLEFKNGVGRYYINNDDTPIYTTSSVNLNNTFGVRLSMYANSSVKIKNFKVYPI